MPESAPSWKEDALEDKPAILNVLKGGARVLQTVAGAATFKVIENSRLRVAVEGGIGMPGEHQNTYGRMSGSPMTFQL
jgi:hypothetical protein